MPRHTPLEPFRDGLRNLYRSLRKEPGTRRDHLDRFIKDGNQYVLSRMERDGPKPKRNHLVNLFKRFEREERKGSATPLLTFADESQRPGPGSPVVEVVPPER